MERNIVLTGFMGSGKTSVGRELSAQLEREFIDMDDFIVEQEGMSINEIFTSKGENYFRNLEKEICLGFSVPESKIIATGGGVIKNDENMKNLKKGGIIFYFKSTPERIAHNLRSDNTRPLLAGDNKEEKIKNLMLERDPLYLKYADVIIDVSNMSIETIAARVKSHL